MEIEAGYLIGSCDDSLGKHGINPHKLIRLEFGHNQIFQKL